jgi:hypothetical protein
LRTFDDFKMTVQMFQLFAMMEQHISSSLGKGWDDPLSPDTKTARQLVRDGCDRLQTVYSPLGLTTVLCRA